MNELILVGVVVLIIIFFMNRRSEETEHFDNANFTKKSDLDISDMSSRMADPVNYRYGENCGKTGCFPYGNLEYCKNVCRNLGGPCSGFQRPNSWDTSNEICTLLKRNNGVSFGKNSNVYMKQ